MKSYHFNLINCPPVIAMILVIGDNVCVEVEDLYYKIPKENERIKEIFREVYNPTKKNPAKKGIVGRYRNRVLENLSSKEKEILCEIVEEYDDVMKISKNILFKKIFAHFDKICAKEEEKVFFSRLCMICAVSKIAYDFIEYEVNEVKKILNTSGDIYLGNHMKIEHTPIKGICYYLDTIYGECHGDLSMPDIEGYEQALLAYGETISNPDKFDVIIDKIRKKYV